MVDVSSGAPVKRTASVDSPQEAKRARHGSTGAAGVMSGAARTDASKPIDKQYCDAVVNFLLRIACQVTQFRPGNMQVLFCAYVCTWFLNETCKFYKKLLDVRSHCNFIDTFR